MAFAQQRDPLLIGALIISVLLHLLLGVLLAVMPEFGQTRTDQAPIIVEVVPPRKPPAPPRTRELEPPPRPAPAIPRERPAKRLGPEDRVAPKETAPQGEDTEDRRPSAPSRQAAPQAATPPRSPAPSAPAPSQAPATGEAPLRPTAPQGEFPASAPTPGGSRPSPSLEQLTTLAPATRARMESDWRKKYREGVERGDTVWLDTEQDLLISFFRRFKDGIYRVWNYPESARQREEQGRCLLRITVNRQGGVENVELLESSGSYALDEEAMRAVRKGQPYGPLPAAYPNPELNIMGYFTYNLTRGFKYPGRIH